MVNEKKIKERLDATSQVCGFPISIKPSKKENEFDLYGYNYQKKQTVLMDSGFTEDGIELILNKLNMFCQKIRVPDQIKKFK